MEESGKNKFNLDEFKKEQIYKTPNGYFEELPQLIQSRVVAEEARKQAGWLPAPKLALRYALPVFTLLLLATFFLVKNSDKTMAPGDIIAQVDDEAIIYYLQNEVEISSDDILESVPQGYFEDDFGSVTDGMEDINIDNEMLEEYGIEQDLTF